MGKESVMLDRTAVDHVTYAVAAAAVASPLLMRVIEATHDTVVWALPLMGFAWLALQMYFKIKNENRRNRH